MMVVISPMKDYFHSQSQSCGGNVAGIRRLWEGVRRLIPKGAIAKLGARGWRVRSLDIRRGSV